MSKKSITPFANDSDAMLVGELNIENGMDKIAIFGNIDLTKDKIGLNNTLALKAVIDRIVDVLKTEKLPEKLAVSASSISTIKNPFANDN